MERESFENEAIAKQMNENYVCIKVDREERPDVDDIYMTAVQMITGRGGWPMSVWLTPPGTRGESDRGLEPFFGGTYFPAVARQGMTSFPQLLSAITDAWNQRKPQILDQTTRITDGVRQQLAHKNDAVEVGAGQVGQAISGLLRIYDRDNAGYGQAPKFPQPVFGMFLIEALPTIDDPVIKDSVARSLRHTLDRMAMGGMYDQVGGGFHRYSTDTIWLVPHFEKMLYDNGQLATLYARSYMRDAASGGGDAFDALVIRRMLDYVLREMTDDRGGFYSAQDAEVDGHEGQNYLWSDEEFVDVLGEDDAAFAAKTYGVSRGPNFSDPHHPEDERKNVLFLTARPDGIAQKMKMSEDDFERRLASVNERLYAARVKRKQPRLDDKVLAGWNGLMIAGLADGSRALKEKKYYDAAQKAADFILKAMRDTNGELLRTYRNGSAKTPAFLEDYAMFIRGLLALHAAGEALNIDATNYLTVAAELTDRALKRFEDPDVPGALYDTLPEQTDLIVRLTSSYDGAVPSGPSVMLNDLITLYARTSTQHFLDKALDVLSAMSPMIAQNPISPIESTRGLQRLLQIDAEQVAAIGAGHEGGAELSIKRDDTPVKVFAGAERVVVPAMGKATLPLELRIDKGFHITAHDPGIEDLIPLNIEIAGGKGVALSVEYPKGEPYNGQALPPEDRGKMKVHTGTLALLLKLERTDDQWSGRPIVIVTYQACDDSACFQPMTVELDVAIDPG